MACTADREDNLGFCETKDLHPFKSFIGISMMVLVVWGVKSKCLFKRKYQQLYRHTWCCVVDVGQRHTLEYAKYRGAQSIEYENVPRYYFLIAESRRGKGCGAVALGQA